MNERALEILMIEDNPDDVELAIEALQEAKMLIHIEAVHDGLEALKYLRKEDPYQNKTTPDLILLDLNMPRMDGRQVLAEIKQDHILRRIPVVVLTTSSAEDDIIKAYEHHVNCYITKPVDFEQFLKVVQAIENFWFTVVQLPPKE